MLKEKARAKQYSPMTLAFLGDAVFELLVRDKITENGSMPVKKLHNRAVDFVCAKAQHRAAVLIRELLTEEEAEIYKRGRNANVTVPQSANPGEYHAATGLEALFGYLFKTGQMDRISEIFSIIWNNTGSNREE